MKRKSLVIVLMLIFTSLFAETWAVNEVEMNYRFKFEITAAPAEYDFLIGTTVFGRVTSSYFKNLFANPCKERILEYLENNKFEINKEDDIDCVFLSNDFFDVSYNVSKKQLEYIYNLLSKKYAGFKKMKEKGFDKKKFLKIKNSVELIQCLDKYIEDGHFELNIGDTYYHQKTAFDEGSIMSEDPANLYLEKETSNAYYVRFNSCVESEENTAYFNKFPLIGYSAWKKDFLIIDSRSNFGGSDSPQIALRKSLNQLNYEGTVIILQDNWSFSSGEVWRIFGIDSLWGFDKTKFKRMLVGTHSGGVQNYGNCEIFENRDLKIHIYFGHTDFTKSLPSNYLGDCKGYEPDVWATTQTMASVLSDLGVDVTGIEFK